MYKTNSEQIIFDIKAPRVSAQIALQGAQILNFNNGVQDLLWLSPHAVFDGHSAIRGGIPLCLPWFGANQHDSAQAKHGFVRNHEWQLIAASESTEEICLGFKFIHTADTRYPYNFEARINWRLSTTLKAELSILNHSNGTIPLSFALHSYFKVQDKYGTTVNGLDQHTYLDNTQALNRRQQHGAIAFTTEVDRVYESCEWPLQLDSHATPITITSSNMPTAIIWNPDTSGLDNHDIQQDYTQFVCVERGAAFANELQLAPHASYHATMTIKTQ